MSPSPRVRRVTALDPGTHYCGWAIVQAQPGVGAARYEALELGVITMPGLPLLRRFGHLARELRVVVKKSQDLDVKEVAIEEPFQNRNAGATLAIAGARAICAGVFVEAGFVPFEYRPQVWKTITGNGWADKGRVANVVKALLRLDYDLPLDAADAGGIGVHHLSVRG